MPEPLAFAGPDALCALGLPCTKVEPILVGTKKGKEDPGKETLWEIKRSST